MILERELEASWYTDGSVRPLGPESLAARLGYPPFGGGSSPREAEAYAEIVAVQSRRNAPPGQPAGIKIEEEEPCVVEARGGGEAGVPA